MLIILEEELREKKKGERARETSVGLHLVYRDVRSSFREEQ